MSPEREERAAYFAMLGGDFAHPLELRSRHPHSYWLKDFAASPEDADELAHRRVTSGHDVFGGVLPRLGSTGDDQRRYAPAHALWVDCDTQRAVRKLELFEPQPTAVVLSGGVDGDTPKRHPYWALTRPLPADQVKRHVKRLAHHLEADTDVVDAGRVLRVPGSRSYKTGRVARLASFTGEAHGLAELTGDLPDAPDWQPDDEPKPAKTDDELVALFRGRYHEQNGDGRETGRHEHYRSVVGVLLRRCVWLPPDVLLELAVSWAKDHTAPCRDRAELERNFDNLLDRERKRRGFA